MALAQACGARSVCLSPALASETNDGQVIRDAQHTCASRRPSLTTADATTSAAILFTLEWILARVVRDLRREQIAVRGDDPLAFLFLRLLLATLPHPASLTLCVLPGQDTHNAQCVAAVRHAGFAGEIVLGEMQGGEMAPDEVYEATLLLGTASLLKGLDIARLSAGTLIFRLSGLSPLVSGQLAARIRASKDILVSQADELISPAPLQEQRVFDKGSLLDLLVQGEEGCGLRTPYQIKSTLLAGLAVANLDVPPTLRQVDTKTVQGHYFALRRAGFRGTAPFLGVQDAASAYLTQFRVRFRHYP